MLRGRPSKGTPLSCLMASRGLPAAQSARGLCPGCGQSGRSGRRPSSEARPPPTAAGRPRRTLRRPGRTEQLPPVTRPAPLPQPLRKRSCGHSSGSCPACCRAPAGSCLGRAPPGSGTARRPAHWCGGLRSGPASVPASVPAPAAAAAAPLAPVQPNDVVQRHVDFVGLGGPESASDRAGAVSTPALHFPRGAGAVPVWHQMVGSRPRDSQRCGWTPRGRINDTETAFRGARG